MKRLEDLDDVETEAFIATCVEWGVWPSDDRQVRIVLGSLGYQSRVLHLRLAALGREISRLVAPVLDRMAGWFR